MISAYRMIYSIFSSDIYHKPHSILKSKSQEFHNKNIGLFSGNDTRMTGYFMGIHRDPADAKISSIDHIVPTNNKFDKAVRYIHDNKP